MIIIGDLSICDFKDVECKGGFCVVICYLDGDLIIKYMVKIFDVLDYFLMGDLNCDFCFWEICVECMDCIVCVDLDYVMEVVVYEGFLCLGMRNLGILF